MKIRYYFSAIIILIIFGFLHFIQSIINIPVTTDKKADAIIVLTGGHDRLYTGLNLLRKNKADRMLLSGVNKNLSYSTVINALNLAPSEKGLISKIDIGQNALNTAGNAKETAQWVKQHNYKKLYIVTNSYHMPRSLLEMRMVLPNATLLASPVKKYTYSMLKNLTMNDLIILIHEFTKYLKTNVKYYYEKLLSSQCSNWI